MTAGAVVLLVYGADRAVTGAVRLSLALGMSKVIIGATIVSLGTTSPEAFVSVNAAFKGEPGLALGNGVGSIICDTALIFALGCMLTRLPKDRFVLRRQGAVQIGSGVLLVGVCLLLAAWHGGFVGVEIPRLVGVVFVILLVGYMYASVRWARVHPEMIPDEADVEVDADPGPEEAAARSRAVAAALANLMLLGFGLALVVLGSEVMIGSVTQLSLRYGVPESVLAVTVVAFGTSLPELVTAMATIVKGHSELLVGNVIGADILNVLFVVGASAMAVPLEVDAQFYWLYLPAMMVALILLRIWIWMPGDRFHRWQGIPLVFLYLAFTTLVVLFGAAEMP